MLAKVSELRTERDRLLADERPEYTGTNKVINGPGGAALSLSRRPGRLKYKLPLIWPKLSNKGELAMGRQSKHKATFEERLAEDARRFKEAAERELPGSKARELLLRRARQAETAASLSDWLSMPQASSSK
jgi:hypothetical protein